MLVEIMVATVIVSLISLIGIFIAGEKIKTFLKYFIAFAAGSMIAASFFDLIPEAFSEISNFESGFLFLVVGIGLFFLIETFIHWHHCESEHCEEEHVHKKPSGILIFTGDLVHNFLDGVLIASSFLLDFHIGLITTLLVVIHEIPQEFGDFAVLLHSGYTKWQAIKINFISALSAIIGGVVGYFALEAIENIAPYAVLIAAGGFLYIALSDIIPELHHTIKRRDKILESLVFIFSMVFMKFFLGILGV